MKLVGDLFVVGVMALSVYGILSLHSWREAKIKQVGEQDAWFYVKASALLTSGQICAIDFVWLRISMLIVNLENHKTQEKWNAAWVRRMFWPRLFNNLYPFIYVGFIKKIMIGCPNTETGCIDELEMNLVVYFLARIFTQLFSDAFLMSVVKLQVWFFTSRGPFAGKSFSYVEMQRMAFLHDEQILLLDWTEQALTFSFVACFSVVLPALSGFALLANLFEQRFSAHRDLFFLKRPDPNYAAGIGIWRGNLQLVEMIAVVTNLGFAIFVMKPLREYDDTMKWILFVAAEHVLYIVREAVRSKVPPIPEEVSEIEYYNFETSKRIFANVSHEGRVTSYEECCEVPSIMTDSC
jgi:hypothetical protein